METDLITQGVKLFAAQKYTEAVKKLKEALDVTDDPQQQSNTQYCWGVVIWNKRLKLTTQPCLTRHANTLKNDWNLLRN